MLLSESGLWYNIHVIKRGGHRDDQTTNQKILYHMETQQSYFARTRLYQAIINKNENL